MNHSDSDLGRGVRGRGVLGRGVRRCISRTGSRAVSRGMSRGMGRTLVGGNSCRTWIPSYMTRYSCFYSTSGERGRGERLDLGMLTLSVDKQGIV